MKAEMDERGVITLSPETGAEAYALSQWVDSALVQVNDIARADGEYLRGSRLIVVTAVQDTNTGKAGA